jgi:putative transposase
MMHFEKDNIYHIYNQGNNKQKIFFNRENYLFFLRKIKTHILPYADIFAWCLMPNHFHLMVLVNEAEMTVTDIHGVTLSHPVNKQRTLNQSIAIMLRSYTRAIHKQNGSSGALFREATKAECLNRINGITPSFYNTNSGTIIQIDDNEKNYPKICFNYIHQNPLNAGLVKCETEWEYSSARDYAGLRNGILVNQEKARKYKIFTG